MIIDFKRKEYNYHKTKKVYTASVEAGKVFMNELLEEYPGPKRAPTKVFPTVITVHSQERGCA